MNKITYIGQFGFGTVGQGFYEILQASGKSNFQIKKIVIKDSQKKRSIDKKWFTTDANDILDDSNISIVVEVIDDASSAFKLVKRALLIGKDVISANKKMISENFDELQLIQQKSGRTLLYEAAVAGSIPILQNINSYHKNLKIKRLSAILNGSSNYILSQILHKKWTYNKSLEMAQKMGFAEADPRLDVGGFDARYKLSLLNNLAFNHFVSAQSIAIHGIEQVKQSDFEWAAKHNSVIKLIALSDQLFDGQLVSWVSPAILPINHALARLHDEFNGILIETDYCQEQLLSGKGAGKLPTGSAVFNDLLLLNDGYRYDNQVKERTENIEYFNKVYTSVVIKGELNKLNFPQWIKKVGISEGYILIEIPTELIALFFKWAKDNLIDFFIDLRKNNLFN